MNDEDLADSNFELNRFSVLKKAVMEYLESKIEKYKTDLKKIDVHCK